MPELADAEVQGSVPLPGPLPGVGGLEEECLYPVSPRLLPSRSPYVQPRPLTSSQLRNILRAPAPLQQFPPPSPSLNPALRSLHGNFFNSLLNKGHNTQPQRPCTISFPLSYTLPAPGPGPASGSRTNPQGHHQTSYNLQNLQQQLQQMQLQPR